MRTETSHVTPNESLAVLPGGSNGEFGLPQELTRVIQSGAGCRLETTDGRQMLDFSMGWGSVLVGHARPEVVAAVTERASLGSNFSYPNEEMVKLAQELVRLSPCCQQVRFCASGTEANMYCLRLARAFTGRNKIVKFEGAYHGACAEGVTSLFPSGTTAFPKPEPTSAGIEHAVEHHLLIAPYNDLATTADIVNSHANEIAAIIVEPLQRCLAPQAGFLEGLRQLCTRHQLLLLFDEVVTGFRLAYGGAQEYYGVTPDLVAYGKALGGGYPIGVFGGRKEIMNMVREDRMQSPDYVWMACTLGGNAISCTAANAALGVFREDNTFEYLHDLGRYFRDGLLRTMVDTGHKGQVVGDGPMGQLVFADQPITDYRGMLQADKVKARAAMLKLFEYDVFLNPMGTKLYLSLAHDREVCDDFLERLRTVLISL